MNFSAFFNVLRSPGPIACALILIFRVAITWYVYLDIFFRVNGCSSNGRLVNRNSRRRPGASLSPGTLTSVKVVILLPLCAANAEWSIARGASSSQLSNCCSAELSGYKHKRVGDNSMLTSTTPTGMSLKSRNVTPTSVGSREPGTGNKRARAFRKKRGGVFCGRS